MRADITLYINFALHAVLGKLGEADTILRFAGEAIRRVADEIAAECPIELAPIYRGILLDPAEPFRVGSSLSFLSWSEDRDVALWFACPRSLINEPLVQRNSALCGYVAELPAPRSRVLFHHSWASALGGLACFALAHPLMGREGKRQIEWSLRSQREVITEPTQDLRPERAVDLDAATLKALDQRLIVEEGI